MDSKLLLEILQGIKLVGCVKILIIFTMRSFNLNQVAKVRAEKGKKRIPMVKMDMLWENI